MKDRELRKQLVKCGILTEEGIRTFRMIKFSELDLYQLAYHNSINTTHDYLYKRIQELNKKFYTLLHLLNIEEFDESKGLKKGKKKVEY